ncbi:MAG: hypothetical protein JXB32_23470 [Deltaproteobacteria bacterium]|nr:hypothetical protein [Deltaproteobacteria bacterium]
MIHFVLSGGPIPADHLRHLVNHFHRRGVAHRVHARLGAGDVVPGDACVACDVRLGEALGGLRERVFQVQLAHNLTGLKGSPFRQSSADLNVLPGRQIVERYDLDPTDPRFVVAGYPKWDAIHAERSRAAERRATLAAERAMDPERPWVVFYPTGPSASFSGNLGRASDLYERLQRGLGPLEFVCCNHAGNEEDARLRDELDRLRELAARDSRFQVVSGRDALPFVTACDLFLTDIASPLLTALSLDKPVLFLPIETTEPFREPTRRFQCGAFVDDVTDLRSFLENYRTPHPLRNLLRRCVAFDDDRNCERVGSLILGRYDRWRDTPVVV